VRFEVTITVSPPANCIHSPGNHTVTQSSFADPCQLLSGGFDSGWISVPAGTSSGFAEWNLTITDATKRKRVFTARRWTYIDANLQLFGTIANSWYLRLIARLEWWGK
jgi:hypothetical protein